MAETCQPCTLNSLCPSGNICALRYHKRLLSPSTINRQSTMFLFCICSRIRSLRIQLAPNCFDTEVAQTNEPYHFIPLLSFQSQRFSFLQFDDKENYDNFLLFRRRCCGFIYCSTLGLTYNARRRRYSFQLYFSHRLIRFCYHKITVRIPRIYHDEPRSAFRLFCFLFT